MDWISRLNSAIGYIEEHLGEDIDYEQLGKIACCSTYHFQRMFAYIAGVPLSEYIRRRRMTKAAVALQNGDVKVIDAAMQFGYDSPTAFNRAFQAVHGIPPSQAKNPGVLLKAYPPISFSISIKGDVEMQYKIENKDAFRIVGVGAGLPVNMEQSFEIVPPMWQKAAMDGTIQKLASMMNHAPMGILGVCAFLEDGQGRYYIAVSTDAPLEGNLEECHIPAHTWAIFPGEGPMPEAIQAVEKRIMSEWFPSSGYEYANGPDIEVYLNQDTQNTKFEVWIPVVKKDA